MILSKKTKEYIIPRSNNLHLRFGFTHVRIVKDNNKSNPRIYLLDKGTEESKTSEMFLDRCELEDLHEVIKYVEFGTYLVVSTIPDTDEFVKDFNTPTLTKIFNQIRTLLE